MSQNRKPKNPITFQIKLSEEQKTGKEVIINSAVTVVTGKAGSGKSLLCANAGLDLLFKGDINQLIITRPAVAAEDLGYLPGDEISKIEPYVRPLKKCIRHLYKSEKTVENLIQEGKIEIAPVGFLRGDNFYPGSLVIIEEAQNLTKSQTKLILTRLCEGSRLVFCGDSDQIDLKNPKQSGFEFMCKHLTKVEGFSLVELKENHRHKIITEILSIYEENDK
jgi:phosphate starvation-inducible PhoH-like protein